jgi:hypothetical protein
VTREQLQATQARLIGLQSLETEYRSRLRTWASGVLIDLDDGAPQTPRSTASSYSVDFGAVDDLGEPDGLMTTYHVDVVNGEVRFGDGVTGDIPDSDAASIDANYRAGAGAYGVVPEGAPDYGMTVPVVDLRTPLGVADGDADRDGYEVSPEADVDLDIPVTVFPPSQPNRPAARPARSWFAPVGSPHRPADA